MNKNMIISNEQYHHSKESIEGASALINNIKNGSFSKKFLPNTSPNFTGDLEHEDYVSFKQFLESTNGKLLLNQLEE